MEKIIKPRWEWRTFADDFSKLSFLQTEKKNGHEKSDEDWYLLSKTGNNNVKFRKGVLDVKSLKETDSNGLECWKPELRMNFPTTSQQIIKLHNFLQEIPLPDKTGEYSFTDFILNFILNNKQLTIIKTSKKRQIYVINQCIVEYVKGTFDGMAFQSICVEHTDPQLVLETIARLKLESHSNVSYLKKLKQISK